MQKYIIFTLASLAVIVGLALWGRPSGEDTYTSSYASALSLGSLISQEESFDFGSISMAAGTVTHNFIVKNTGSDPITIGKMYTSCMCTEASLITAVKRFGPYGMQGHGMIPRTNVELAPGEEATVEAVFDPAAHGPAGIGQIRRTITMENSGGRPLEFTITANVTP